MFADPQTLTVNAVAKNLVRVKPGSDSTPTEYLLRETTGEYLLKIRNTKRVVNNVTIYRHTAEFTYTLYSTVLGDPDTVRKIYFVLENYKSDLDASVKHIANALQVWATDTNFGKLLNMES